MGYVFQPSVVLDEIYDLIVFMGNVNNRKITVFNDNKDIHKLVY